MRLLADSAATEASKTTLSVVASSVKQPEFPKPNSTKRKQKPKAYTMHVHPTTSIKLKPHSPHVPPQAVSTDTCSPAQGTQLRVGHILGFWPVALTV